MAEQANSIFVGPTPRELAEGSAHWFELFDEMLTNQEVPISERPMKAATLLLQYGIIEVRGGDKSRYLEESWFGHLVGASKFWYDEIYGKGNCKPADDAMVAIVRFRGSALQLRFPRTLTEVETEGERFWLSFPSKLTEREDPFSYFEQRPNIEGLDAKSRAVLAQQIAQVIRWTRSTYLNTFGAGFKSDQNQALARTIWQHMQSGVGLLRGETHAFSLAIWEFFFAVEKSFKAYIAQRAPYDKVHSLTDLNNAAAGLGFVLPDGLLEQLPNDREAIKYRYAQTAISLTDAVAVYFSALECVFEITAALTQEISINDAALLIQRPPWIFPPAN